MKKKKLNKWFIQIKYDKLALNVVALESWQRTNQIALALNVGHRLHASKSVHIGNIFYVKLFVCKILIF